MLSSHLPFWRDAKDRNPLGIMTSILSEDIKFEGAPWDSISDEARDFVARLLDRSAGRISWAPPHCVCGELCWVLHGSVQQHRAKRPAILWP